MWCVALLCSYNSLWLWESSIQFVRCQYNYCEQQWLQMATWLNVLFIWFSLHCGGAFPCQMVQPLLARLLHPMCSIVCNSSGVNDEWWMLWWLFCISSPPLLCFSYSYCSVSLLSHLQLDVDSSPSFFRHFGCLLVLASSSQKLWMEIPLQWGHAFGYLLSLSTSVFSTCVDQLLHMALPSLVMVSVLFMVPMNSLISSSFSSDLSSRSL